MNNDDNVVCFSDAWLKETQEYCERKKTENQAWLKQYCKPEKANTHSNFDKLYAMLKRKYDEEGTPWHLRFLPEKT
ncbi:MAG: hypothetical protein AAFR99_15590 [Cyanobacteria bacterium J06629_9]